MAAFKKSFLIHETVKGGEMGSKKSKSLVCDAILLASILPYIFKVNSHFWL